MARIAYVDHSYHEKTQSTQFLADMLRKRGHTVDFFWDNEWKGGAATPFSQVADYDVIIMFQSRCSCKEPYFRRLHHNVIHVPMLDALALRFGPVSHQGWHWESFQGCKILSFSSAVHAIATSFGLRSFLARYYPPLENRVPMACPPRAFFWVRHEELVSWPVVRTLLGGERFDSVHLHIALDPTSPGPTLPSKTDQEEYAVTTSTWFADQRDFLSILERANIYFAPRREEGIGRSFLEAMARGQCVVAPDHGTMNEYIVHGLNGLLYDPNRPEPLDFSNFTGLGEAARQSVAAGRERWLAMEDRLEEFILTPAPQLYRGLYRHGPLRRRDTAPPGPTQNAPDPSELPPGYSLPQLIEHYNKLKNSKWRKIGVFLGLTNKYPE